MLWEHALVAYVIIGVLTASITMYVFPPMEGFRPPIAMVLSGFLVFLLLWPVLALLALWYQTVSCLHRRSQRRSKPAIFAGNAGSANSAEIPPSTVGQLPVSKPR